MAIETEQHLLDLIASGTQESLTLEYKRCAALQNNEDRKNEISKDVSAFANAAGGNLIYGIVENGQVPQALDGGFDPAGGIRREWLEQVIGSRIQPRIDGVVIRVVNLTGTNAGRFALAVEVPQSHTAHQASDKKYYKRQNFTVVPMEDYEIRDVFNRAKTPLILTDIGAQRLPGSTGQQADFRIVLSLLNDGDVSARSIRLELGLYFDLVAEHGGHYYGTTERRNRREGRDYREIVYIVQRDDVIFPKQQIALSDWGITPPALRVNAEKFITARNAGAEARWTVYADDMRRQEGFKPLFPDILNF
jgi:hypothetical protein